MLKANFERGFVKIIYFRVPKENPVMMETMVMMVFLE